MAKNKATAGDFIQQLVGPYLNAEGDIAKKGVKELDSMIAAWKLVPKINHQGDVWPGATFPKVGTGAVSVNSLGYSGTLGFQLFIRSWRLVNWT